MYYNTYKDSLANHRLLELGLSPEILVRAVTEGQLAHSNCTENDPRIFSGLAVWARMNRSLREQLIPLGWTKGEKRGQPITLSPEKDVAIVVFSGDDATGCPDRIPQPRNPKGTATLAAVEMNKQQLILFPEYRHEGKATPDRLTWVLLFARDKDFVRCELSLPSAVEKDGTVMTWAERIILPAITLGDELVVSETSDEPPVDVEVIRKSS